MTQTTPVPRTDRRERLIALGIELFSRHAYDELSMDEIAAEAGVVKGVLYYYFGSKRGYYVAAVSAAAAELRGQWDVAGGASPLERVRAGLGAYIAYAGEHAAGYRTLMAGGVGSDPEVRAILQAERDLVIARVVEGLGLRKTPAALRVGLEGWMSAMEGATLAWLDKRDLKPDQLRELLLGMLGGALAAASAMDPKVPPALPVQGPGTRD
jgi:AcrR family transcriptional regulator